MCSTFERVDHAVAHDVPQLRVAGRRGYDQVLFGRRDGNRPNRTGAADSHCTNLRWQRHRQPSNEWHE